MMNFLFSYFLTIYCGWTESPCGYHSNSINKLAICLNVWMLSCQRWLKQYKFRQYFWRFIAIHQQIHSFKSVHHSIILYSYTYMVLHWLLFVQHGIILYTMVLYLKHSIAPYNIVLVCTRFYYTRQYGIILKTW